MKECEGGGDVGWLGGSLGRGLGLARGLGCSTYHFSTLQPDGTDDVWTGGRTVLVARVVVGCGVEPPLPGLEPPPLPPLQVKTEGPGTV